MARWVCGAGASAGCWGATNRQICAPESAGSRVCDALRADDDLVVMALVHFALVLHAFMFADARALRGAFFGSTLTHTLVVTGMIVLVHDDDFLRGRVRDGAQQDSGESK